VNPENRLGRVDFHLHSRASNVTDYYAANAFAIPESYSDPAALHAMLRARGMDLVTLTDHNSIDGVKSLLDAGHADVFPSAEMTATFPEDGCHIHVTVAGMTEGWFTEVNRLRGNVYEMLAWLETEGIAGDPALVWFMTHPLMSTQNRPYGRDGALRVEHLERMLVVCPAFEVQNGARTRALNDLTAQMLARLDRPMLERLADKHDLQPRGERPWQKALLAGSDDHAGINPGRTWTTFPVQGPHASPLDLLQAVRRGQTAPGGAHGGPVTLAHALLKLLHDGGEQRRAGASSQGLVLGGVTRDLLNVVFDGSSTPPARALLLQARGWLSRWARNCVPAGDLPTFEAVLEGEVSALLGDGAFRAKVAATEGTDDRIFLVLGELSNRIFREYFGRLRAAADVNVVLAVKALVALVASNLFLSLPYLVAFLQQSSDCLIARDVRKRFQIEGVGKLVLFTDTWFEVNGVSGTLRRMIAEAERRGVDLVVVTCARPDRALDPETAALVAAGRLKLFHPVSSLGFPNYDGLEIHLPPFLEVLRFVQEGGFTKVQLSTPGTLGLTGLAVAKLLQIETSATYHTSFPEYVENYTRDVSLEALAWRYMILFYHAVDEVVVPSRFVAKLLHKRGLRNRKLLILDRWVDLRRFHPAKRNMDFWPSRGVPEGAVVYVYVGRLGAEKNLNLLAEAWRRLCRDEPTRACLAIVGDGPHRAELEGLLVGLPVVFTGFLGGDTLATALASADVKLFPSTTDTWGNAPLEAQASGVPVIVSNVGGPVELMEEGRTGLVVSGRDAEGLASAMHRLLDPELRRRMGLEARRFAERHDVPQPFTAILDSDAYRASSHDGAHPSRAVLHFPADAEQDVA